MRALSVRRAASSAAGDTSTRCTVTIRRADPAAVEQRRQLLAAAGPELDERRERLDAREDLARRGARADAARLA